MSKRTSLRNRCSNALTVLERLEDRLTPASGLGLLAQYYDNPDLTNLKIAQTDPSVNAQWGAGVAPVVGVAGSAYSVRWSGQVEAKYTEDYTFFATADERVRVWVNGQLLVNGSGTEAATQYSGTISLIAGRRYDLQVEYENHTGGGQVKLEWASASQSRSVIPAGQLFPSERGGLLQQGQKLSGFVYAPVSGYYRFTAGSTAQLYLSNSADPAGKQLIAVSTNPVSAPVYLVAGQAYYIEAQGASSISWIRPGSSTAAVISGEYLSPVLSEVRIYAETGAAVEGEESVGRFTVVRTGPTTTSITVHYTVSGTALSGLDYAALSGSVTFAAGQTSAVINVYGLADELLEGTEIVTIELQDGPGYQVGTISSRTASTSILDNVEAPAGGSPVVNSSPSAFSVFGIPTYGTSQVVSDPRFGQALQVNATAIPPQTYNLQVNQRITAPVKKGDRLLVEFYARSLNGSGQIEVIFEQAAAPNAKSLTQGTLVGSEWTKFQMSFEVREDFAINAATLSFRLGFQIQTIQLAGIRLLNYGPSPSLLPPNFTINETGGDWGTTQTTAVNGPGFSSALQMTTTARPPQTFNFQAFANNTAAVAAGETVTAEFYARTPNGSAANIRSVLQGISGGAVLASLDEVVGPGWTKYTLKFTATQAYAVGTLQLRFNVGFDPQVIQIGGVTWTRSGLATQTTAPAIPNTSTGSLAFSNATTAPQFGTLQYVNVTGPSFTRAVEVATTTVPALPQNYQLTTRNQDAITTGTVVTATFFIRAKTGTAQFQALIQEASGSFQTYGNSGLRTVGTDWVSITITGTVSKDFAIRGLQFAINLGYGPQTVQIANLVITTSNAADPQAFQSDALGELSYTGVGTYGTIIPSGFSSAPNLFTSHTVAVTTVPQTPSQFQATAQLKEAVSAGNVLTLQFYARVNPGTSGAITALLQTAGGLTTLFSRDISLNNTWTQFTFTIPIDQAFAAGGLQVAFFFGSRLQSVQIAGLTLSKTGESLPIVQSLPSLFSPTAYGGREGTADWREEANEQIDEVRKGDLVIQVVDQAGRPIDGAVIYVRQTEQGYKFGTAVDANLVLASGTNADIYRQQLLRLFNTATIESQLKWELYENNPARAVNSVNWLVENGMFVRGHNIIWPRRDNMPDRVWNEYDRIFAEQGADAAAAYMEQEINARIEEIVSVFSGVISEWDVVNEPFTNHDVMDILGDEAVIEWYRAVREADPTIQRFLNDYEIFARNGLNTAHRANFDYWLDVLTAAGVLEGIGEQGHYTTSNLTDMEVLNDLLNTYSQYGLPIAITEFDFTTPDQQLQADYLRDFMTMVFSNPATTEFVQWGFWAGAHWRPDAALFNADWSLKPNGQAYQDLVFGDWWTDVRGTSAWGGLFSTRAFQGDYEVVVEYNGQTVVLPATLGPDGTTLVVTVNAPAKAETPSLSVTPTATGSEGTPITLDIDASLNDLDGTEVLTITIDGVPAGATLSAGINNGDGTWTLTADQLDGLTITVPDNRVPFILTVTATATEPSNGDTASVSANITVTVTNAAPVPTIVSISTPQVEGTAITVTGSATDAAGANDIVTLSWVVFKDGVPGVYAVGGGTSFTFTPNDNGVYRIVLIAFDEDGGSSTTDRVVVVDNVAPTPTIETISSTRVEGTAITVVGSATDPAGVNDTVTLSWTIFKDGVAYATGTGASYTFTPNDNGTYRIVLTASDEDGGSSSTEQTVTVGNVAPTPTIDSVSSTRVEGTAITVTGSATDPAGANDTVTLSWSIYKNGVAYATGTGASFAFTPNDNGSYRIVLTASDEDGGSSTTEQVISVANVAPVPTIQSVSSPLVEGTAITLTGSATDPAGANDIVTLSWLVFKDGVAGTYAVGSGTSFTFTPNDNGIYRVVLFAFDEDGGSSTTDQVLTVSNVAPTPSILSISTPQVEGAAITVTGSATDPAGTNDIVTLSWVVFKDGVPGTYAVGSGTSLTFTPNDNGVYRIMLIAFDEDGGSNTTDQVVTVSNLAPTPTIGSVSTPLVEGTAITVTGSATDPAGVNDTVTLAWTVYKNGVEYATGSGASLTFTPNDNGTYRIVLTASDEDGGSSSTEQIVTVGNLAPTPTIESVSSTRVEGTAITVVGSATDPAGANDTVTLAWSIYKNGVAYATGNGSSFTFTPNDNGSYRIVLTASDEDGGSSTVEQVISVANLAPVPTIQSVSSPLVEGTAITLTGSAVDAAGANDIVTLSWVVFKDGVAGTFASGSGTSFTFTPNDNGTYRVVLLAFDEDGGSSTADQVLTVSNVAPTPAIQSISPTRVEGTPITVVGNATDPGAVDATALTWTVYRGGALYATGSGVNFTFTPNQHGDYRIVLTATDKDGASTTTEQQVSVASVTPTPSVTGPTAAVRGQTLTYSGSSTNLGTSSASAALKWKVTRNGSTYATGSGTNFSFVPTDDGTYQVSLTVTNSFGRTATVTQTVTVSAMAIQEDPLNPGKALLVIGGTTGDDTITVSPGSRGSYEVTIKTGRSKITQKFTPSTTLPLEGIVVYGQAGDDEITVADNISVTAWLFGGAGDDELEGGKGDDVLVGGDGNDKLDGGKGRDFLIGGRGADRVVGEGGDDLLIAGYTDYDNDRAALASLHGVWVDPSISYQQRVRTLKDSTHAVYLGSDTVEYDGSADVLTGGSGNDWFFFDPKRDRVTDQDGDRDRHDNDCDPWGRPWNNGGGWGW